MPKNKNNGFGFTMIELMIVTGLMVFFGIITIPYGLNFYQSRIIEEESRIMFNILERAKSHAVSGKEDSNWGIRFYHDENKYVFFKGSSYENRALVYDRSFFLPSGMETEGFLEIVFEKHTGNPMVFTE